MIGLAQKQGHIIRSISIEPREAMGVNTIEQLLALEQNLFFLNLIIKPKTMSNKILITGGAGYIGSHVAKLFLEKRFEVVSFDNLSHGFKQPLEILKKYGKLTIIKGDLRNKKSIQKVFSENNINAVAHFAALCSVNESMEQPEMYFENNVIGSFNLFEAMRKASVKKYYFFFNLRHLWRS